MTKRLSIIGISGRMGTEIRGLAPEFGFQVVGGVASDSVSIPGATVVRDVAQLDAKGTDLVIDFSLPELMPKVLEWCTKHRKPLVSGVTGLSEEHKRLLASSADKFPLLWAPNMSLGVAVMARMLAQFSRLEGYDFQIEELHHNRKKDKPSGTALFLQEKLQSAVGSPLEAPVAIRGGGIFGIHRVWAMGQEETITLEHTAMNRRVFARGALKAATWLLGRPPGFYSMDDVLNP